MRGSIKITEVFFTLLVLGNFLFDAFTTNAQTFTKAFYRPDGGLVKGESKGVMETEDRGFLNYIDGPGDSITLVKTDSAGNVLWGRVIEDGGEPMDAVMTADTSYLLNGLLASDTTSSFYAKISKKGKLQWFKQFNFQTSARKCWFTRSPNPSDHSIYHIVSDYQGHVYELDSLGRPAEPDSFLVLAPFNFKDFVPVSEDTFCLAGEEDIACVDSSGDPYWSKETKQMIVTKITDLVGAEERLYFSVSVFGQEEPEKYSYSLLSCLNISTGDYSWTRDVKADQYDADIKVHNVALSKNKTPIVHGNIRLGQLPPKEYGYGIVGYSEQGMELWKSRTGDLIMDRRTFRNRLYGPSEKVGMSVLDSTGMNTCTAELKLDTTTGVVGPTNDRNDYSNWLGKFNTMPPSSMNKTMDTIKVFALDTCYPSNPVGVKEINTFSNPFKVTVQDGKYVSVRFLDVGKKSLSLLSLTGREVLKRDVEGSPNIRVPLGGLSSGLYLLRIVDKEDHRVHVEKVVKP